MLICFCVYIFCPVTMWYYSPEIEFWYGARYSSPVQTCPGAHPASIQWVPGLSRDLKGGGVALTTHPI